MKIGNSKIDTLTVVVRIAMAVFIIATLAGSWVVAGWLVPIGVERAELFQVFMLLPANLIVLTTTASLFGLVMWTAIFIKTVATRFQADRKA